MKISGYFEGKKPFIKLYFKGYSEGVGVLIDTGFSGQLVLPQNLVRKLKLKMIGEGKYITVKGKHLIIKVYIAFLHWFGKVQAVTALATKSHHALIGMGLLYDTKLEISGAQNHIVITNSRYNNMCKR
jgi:clan AA aspartic protease